jgi:hypothetical protein
MITEPTVLEDTSETLSPLGEKIAPVVFFLFIGAMAYLIYRDLMLAIRVFGLLFVAAGLGVILYSAGAISRGSRSTRWPVVEATVTRSEVFTRTDRSHPGNQVGTTMYEYYPAVRYEYEVQGQRYRSKRIIFLRTNYTRADAEAAVSRYPMGQRVTAYYNPANPKVAVLEPGLGPNAKHYCKGYLIGVFFGLAGLLFAYGIPWVVSR